MEGFELYQKSRRMGANIPAGPVANVGGNGNITLNSEALSLFGDRIPEYVTLWFNPERKIVALKAANDGDLNAYRLREASNTRSRSIGGKSFFTNYGIEVEKDVYPVSTVGDMVAFSLDKEAPLTSTDTEAEAPKRGRK